MARVYQAVLFDMDGVVIDSEQQVREFWQKLAARYAITLTEDDFIERIFGRKAHDTIELLFAQIDKDELEQTIDTLRVGESDYVYTPISGVLETIQQLKWAGIPTALVTSASDWKINAVLDQLGLTNAFQAIVSAQDITIGKPNPACYLKAAEKLGVAPEGCIVFEDAVSGVAAAINAGMLCVGIGKYRPQLLEAGAAMVVDDFHQLILSPVNDVAHRLEIKIANNTGFLLQVG